ncbi:DUF6415 family natural product biosynthesis protein [Streptomyces sp. LX-29]|uniref:DUF6415 family natural product biosynthesis protein n=1 Tax=Streptomyces sp. LX-29 TaxID=2900152 RepID=UPI00240D97A5|nr:DUF6415 family natural product biosynthesis protein [Streptomyces sp. LX-29]WFB07619.1 DUF6415 family natural product biosynthesis protein [Streptomyces sp. LX-29]
MGRHAKPRRFTLVHRAISSGSSEDRREPGEAWGHELPEQGYLVQDALERTDTDTLRRCLEAMRRQLMSEQTDEPVRITREMVQHTVDYVLSGQLEEVEDTDLGAIVLMLRGYLTVLADEAESLLDTGRAVVREMTGRARRVADEEGVPSRATARHVARTARDLLHLLAIEGWWAARAKSRESARA